MKRIIAIVVALVVIAGVAFAVFGNKTSGTAAKQRIAIVTDVGGIDDHSFNQSAWEGLEKYGKDFGLTRPKGIQYFESKSASDYETNFNNASKGDNYTLIAGIGYSLNASVLKAAQANTSKHYVLVDDIITGQSNVASVMFRSEQSSYLAGVAAVRQAVAQNPNASEYKVGFIGGVKGNVIDAFQAGFQQGVDDTAKAVNKTVTVDVEYADSFTDSAKGSTIAQTMFANKINIIFQAAGGVGTGVFSAAKAADQQLAANSVDKKWVIGVDRDQKDDGAYTSSDKQSSNLTLASSITDVGQGLYNVSKDDANGNFPGGKTVAYGLKEGGVSLAKDSLSDDIWNAVQKAQTDIENGTIKVANHPAGSQFNQSF